MSDFVDAFDADGNERRIPSQWLDIFSGFSRTRPTKAESKPADDKAKK